MADKGFKRKLNAILSADAAGYKRSVCNGAGKTVHTLATDRSAIAIPLAKFSVSLMKQMQVVR